MELGIIGHPTRGEEVIKILEMLGGVNRYNLAGNYNKYFYYISDKYKDISNSHIGPDEIKGYDLYSIEDFLKKFPYKIGDKVIYPSEKIIASLTWDDFLSSVVYGLDYLHSRSVLVNGRVYVDASKLNQINTTSTHCNEEYVIEYKSSYSTKPHILTFNSFQDMETELNNLREYNKLHQIYSDIKCNKITTETLNI